MKKAALFLAVILIPMAAKAHFGPAQAVMTLPAPALPADLSSYSRTATLQWGCPVDDKVEASSQAEALQKIQGECVEQVSRAAAEKPGVMNVITTRVVFPDVRVNPSEEGFKLEGTFFLETLVVQKSSPGDQ